MPEGPNSSVTVAEKQISEMKDRMVEITEAERNNNKNKE